MSDRDKGRADGWEQLYEGPWGEEFHLRVKHGARYLEERGMVDWPARILAAASGDLFEMSCGGRCAVGVVLGDYERDFIDWEQEEGEGRSQEELGFEVSGEVDMWQEYACLEQAWIDLAKEQMG